MTPAEFVDALPSFEKLSATEKIKRFCWYLEVDQNQAAFSGTDVSRCFKEARCSPPSSISPFMASLCKRTPPFLLHNKAGYTLSREARRTFDRTLGQRQATVAADKLLRDLPAKLSSPIEKEYLEEALLCFTAGAFRAAILMTWNVAFSHLCNLIFDKHITAFNAQLATTFAKSPKKPVLKLDDFQDLKEFDVLQIARSSRLITNAEHHLLQEKLNKRNAAAHPSGIKIAPHTADAFIIDILENFILKY